MPSPSIFALSLTIRLGYFATRFTAFIVTENDAVGTEAADKKKTWPSAGPTGLYRAIR